MQLLLRVMQVLELMVHVLVALQLALRVTFSMVLRHGLLLALQLRLPMMVLMVHPMILSCCCPGCNLSKLDFNQAAEDGLDMRNDGPALCCNSEALACFSCCCCSFVAQQHHTRCFITEIRFRNKSFGHARCGETVCRIGYIAKKGLNRGAACCIHSPEPVFLI